MINSQNSSHKSSGNDSTYFSGVFNSNPSNNIYLPPTTPISRSNIPGYRSQPDSGIDPDNCSVSSVVLNDYLRQLGIQPNTLQLAASKPKAELKIKPTIKGSAHKWHTDSDLNNLIYSKVDEIVGPGTLCREADLLAAKNSIFLTPHNISAFSLPSKTKTVNNFL